MELDIFAEMAAWAHGDFKVDDLNVLNADMAKLTEEIERIFVQPMAVPYIMPMAAVPDFDERFDLLDRNFREGFVNTPLFEGYELFTDPIVTTMTLQGTFTNVVFKEQQLVGENIISPDFLACLSNYEKLYWPLYQSDPPCKASNRGRKKKEKVLNKRKCQGTGDEMASQITYVIRAQTNPVSYTEIIPFDAKKYKFKVFCNGRLQLPGAKPSDIDDIIACSRLLADNLNLILHPNEEDLAKQTELAHLNPSMVNYKFKLKIPEDHIILVDKLRLAMNDPELDNRPAFVAKCNEYRSLAVEFAHPTQKRPDKTIRFQIFAGGAINILGGIPDIPAMRPCCEFMHRVFQKHGAAMVRKSQ